MYCCKINGGLLAEVVIVPSAGKGPTEWRSIYSTHCDVFLHLFGVFSRGSWVYPAHSRPHRAQNAIDPTSEDRQAWGTSDRCPPRFLLDLKTERRAYSYPNSPRRSRVGEAGLGENIPKPCEGLDREQEVSAALLSQSERDAVRKLEVNFSDSREPARAWWVHLQP